MKKALILILLLTLLPLTYMSATSGELIKGESFSAVYYKAIDGQRYVFPNQRIYNSWYADFSTVRTVTDAELTEVPLGGNVFYKPNSRLVKITTDPKVYWVDEFGVLRHIISEAAAQALFDSDWVNKIDDLPDEFFTNYTIGEAIDADFSLEINDSWTIDDNQQLTQRGKDLAAQDSSSQQQEEEEREEEIIIDEGQQPESINLTVTVVDEDITAYWIVYGGNTDYGFALVKSKTENPVYPDDSYKIISDKSITQYEWTALGDGVALHFRICRLNSDGSCGTYSDDESIITGTTIIIPTITLTGAVEDGIVKLSWEKEWLSPNYGFYLVRDTNLNPRYPTHPYIWLAKYRESYDWKGLSYGAYHFRICKYMGSDAPILCDYYSNDLELTIE